MLKSRRGGYELGNRELRANHDSANDGIPVEQNFKSHSVYAFKDGCENSRFSDDENEDSGGQDAIELYEIRSRNSTKRATDSAPIRMSKSEIVTHKITKSDSLQGIALLYGCTMAEIKQANGIYKEQDLHALKKVKIPVHQFSCHLDKEEVPPKTGVSTAKKNLRQLLDLPLPDEMEIETDRNEVSSPLSCSSPGTEASVESYGNDADGIKSFLKQVDKGINKVCQKLDVEEVTNPGFSLVPPHAIKEEDRLGTICGISWKGFLVTLCVMAVAFPALGLLYYSYNKRKGQGVS